MTPEEIAERSERVVSDLLKINEAILDLHLCDPSRFVGTPRVKGEEDCDLELNYYREAEGLRLDLRLVRSMPPFDFLNIVQRATKLSDEVRRGCAMLPALVEERAKLPPRKSAEITLPS